MEHRHRFSATEDEFSCIHRAIYYFERLERFEGTPAEDGIQAWVEKVASIPAYGAALHSIYAETYLQL